MSRPEAVIIEIDASQLDEAIVKLEILGTKAGAVVGGRAGKKLDTALPTINRELRLILGQIPGLRQAMQYWFRIRRLEHGLAVGGAQYYLTIIATAIILLKQVQQYERKMRKQREDLERLIRKSRGWTHEEYERGQAAWKEHLRGVPG